MQIKLNGPIALFTPNLLLISLHVWAKEHNCRRSSWLLQQKALPLSKGHDFLATEENLDQSNFLSTSPFFLETWPCYAAQTDF
jgi:hypothetical protein